MERLTEGARVIVNVLKNVGSHSGGLVPADDIQMLFPGEARLFQSALKEVTKHGLVESRAGGALALTPAGDALGAAAMAAAAAKIVSTLS
jgi:2-phospho-L-lactate transferase/gluconeogenesis factor (CofD/UPF0052 family)